MVIDQRPASVEQILSDLGINPLEVIISRNGTLVPEDTIVEADDEIRIIRISHGGSSQTHLQVSKLPYAFPECHSKVRRRVPTYSR